MAHVYLKDQILNHLKKHHMGAHRAVQSAPLEMFFDISGRKIRDIVNALRCEGHPICSDENGYYYGETALEVMRSINQLKSRTKKINEAQTGLVRSLSKFEKHPKRTHLKVWVVKVKGG
ncbi:MAG TPA: hypothetical protein PK366_00695 [Fibrobacteraceae bacterium]|nr:hypothetical protein [Fibrobacteraceae bacterium]